MVLESAYFPRKGVEGCGRIPSYNRLVALPTPEVLSPDLHVHWQDIVLHPSVAFTCCVSISRVVVVRVGD